MNIPFTISGLRAAGLTQTQIGAAIGLKQSSVSDLLTGRSGARNPSAKVVNGLARLAAEHKVPTQSPEGALNNLAGKSP